MASSEVFIIFVSSGFSEYCYNREIERGGGGGEEEKRRRGAKREREGRRGEGERGR